MEPGLRASPRRIHAPKSIKLCVSKGGIALFLGTAERRCKATQFVLDVQGDRFGGWGTLILELSLSLAGEPQTKARQLFALVPHVQNRNKAPPD